MLLRYTFTLRSRAAAAVRRGRHRIPFTDPVNSVCPLCGEGGGAGRTFVWGGLIIEKLNRWTFIP